MATVPVEERDVYTIPETAKRLGYGLRQTYELARLGRIPAVKLGMRRYVVPKARFERWLAGEGPGAADDGGATAA